VSIETYPESPPAEANTSAGGLSPVWCFAYNRSPPASPPAGGLKRLKLLK
jgi:hypothetical protein